MADPLLHLYRLIVIDECLGHRLGRTGTLSQLCMESIARRADASMKHIPYPPSPPVTTAKRSPFLPDVPTLTESGIDVQSDAWNALVGPGGLPGDVVAKINAEVVQTLSEPAVIEKLKLQLITPSPTTPDQLRKRMADEKALWAEVIKAAKIRID
ncbi:tripartite tricarboxylate transporter substrate-binding protein [Bradyrhizobium sp. NFR13]|uniref:Bug family tripartite tricarboxylate transporter substrate binding protein n=1 Tax=Bradyrhizobium sp. NFR13 TaxID=1566285 RepID=UPI002570CE95|nr:tripartite tricarboxylate transporter substrate-binding protein [Bradyrhizobium sp. NFR13]